MRPLLSAEQMRHFDRCATSAGVSGIILMENAGRGAAHLIGLKLKPRRAGESPRTGSNVVGTCVRCADERSLLGGRVVVLTGGGNNGGDGFVVARHLAARAAQVTVLMHVPQERLEGDALLAYDAMRAVGVQTHAVDAVDLPLELSGADLVVDALLGTGVNRDVGGALLRTIEAVNDSGAFVVSLDVPSGLDATLGVVHGAAIRARHTVTFAHLKTGLLTTFGHEYGGDLTVSHIGVPSTLPPDVEPAAWLLEESDARSRVRSHSASGHKGDSGRVVILAGSPGTLGAARLTSRAALRGGAGLVTLCNSPEAVHLLDQEVVEVMTHAWGSSGPAEAEDALFRRADALVVGPGLGQSGSAHAALRCALVAGRPTVVDADALRFVSSEGRTFWDVQSPGAHCVLTPHAAEAGALLGTSAAAVEADRFGSARALAETYGATILLKGSRPILAAPGRAPVVSAFGTRALATGGSGDVFCGILAAQLIGAHTKETIFDRLIAAVTLQGQAAELWSQNNGDGGLLASEIADLVPQVLARWG